MLEKIAATPFVGSLIASATAWLGIATLLDYLKAGIGFYALVVGAIYTTLLAVNEYRRFKAGGDKPSTEQ